MLAKYICCSRMLKAEMLTGEDTKRKHGSAEARALKQLVRREAVHP